MGRQTSPSVVLDENAVAGTIGPAMDPSWLAWMVRNGDEESQHARLTIQSCDS